MIALIALFTALAAVGAFIKIPIGTVPVTLQFAFCNLAMLLLGVKWGTLSIGLYVILGLVGVPVFTLGGGFSYVLQPTFGYILGFVAGCFLGGLICSRGTMGLARRLVASFVNLAVVYVIGVLYLGLIMKFYLGSEVDVPHIIVAYGLVFIPTDGLWAVLSSLAAPRLIPNSQAQLRRRLSPHYRERQGVDAKTAAKACLCAALSALRRRRRACVRRASNGSKSGEYRHRRQKSSMCGAKIVVQVQRVACRGDAIARRRMRRGDRRRRRAARSARDVGAAQEGRRDQVRAAERQDHREVRRRRRDRFRFDQERRGLRGITLGSLRHLSLFCKKT